MLVADVIVGALFGDEGKGKLVGRIGSDYDVVMRVNASTNAGHCVSDGENAWITRQLPSVFHPTRTRLVVAPGALLNLPRLVDELLERPDIEALSGGVLRLASSLSLVIRPYIEKGRGFMSKHIGSTHQGTGPSAVARAARHSLRLYDIAAVYEGVVGARAEVIAALRRTCEETLPEHFPRDAREKHDMSYLESVLEENVAAYAKLVEVLGPACVGDHPRLLAELHASGAEVLIEGCNGMLLDNLHGAHPHTTSTPTNLGAMICGANIAPACVRRSLVVMASYATCLGKRPFPTEMTADDSAHFYTNCNEVDVAEHQARRLGWLDLPALRKALIGSTGAELHLNKLDVLSGLETIRVATAYRIAGERYAMLPDDARQYRAAEAIYETLPGWSEPLQGCRSWESLPEAARAFVERVEAELGLPITSLGVGPRNDDFIVR